MQHKKYFIIDALIHGVANRKRYTHKLKLEFMTLQFICDNQGNTTGVYIPIEDWQSLKTKYIDFEKEEAQNDLSLSL